MPKQPGQTSAPGQPQQVQGQPKKDTQVIAQGSKTLGTVDNPQLAQQIKQSIGKGEMTLMPGEEMSESDDDYSAKKARAGKDIGKPGKNFAKIAKSSGGGEKGKRIAGAVLAKLRAKTNEADIPSDDSDFGAGLGAGRSQATYEAKKAKPDYIDLDKDGNKKETMKKAASDKKKEKVTENAHRHSSARLLGKAHALAKEAYNCRYDDMEEARMYHEGYKEGLDECYGLMPIRGVVVGEEVPATVPGMADQAERMAMEADLDEMADLRIMNMGQNPTAPTPNIINPEGPITTSPKKGIEITSEKAQVPVIITRDMKQQLSDLGYKKADIQQMKPEEANEIISKGKSKLSKGDLRQIEIREKKAANVS